MANDLNELNSILFDTLRGVKDGTIETMKANVVVGISNALVNNAKVQIQAIKLTGSKKPTRFLGVQAGPEITEDRHQNMTIYAKKMGYDSVTEAINNEGKDDFVNSFEQWFEEQI